MFEAILTDKVRIAEIKEVFSSYPELEYGQCSLINENRVLIIKASVKEGSSFNAATQGKVFSAWLGEKVGEYEMVRFDSSDGVVTIKFKTEDVAEYILID